MEILIWGTLGLITLYLIFQRIKEKKSILLNKAKRQSIPAFREKGVWKIGSSISLAK